MSDCLISFGSNLGDSAALFAETSELLKKTPGIESVVASQPIRTPAVGGPAGQPPYFNAAIRCDTSLEPDRLHQGLLRIETALGRVRRQRWGSRTVDLDLLLYDTEQVESLSLTIPHPRMACRRFVLQPSVEIAGEMKHPLCDCTVEELLACLNSRPNRIVVVDDSPSPPDEWFEQLALSVEDEPFRLVSGHVEPVAELEQDEWQLIWLDSSAAQRRLEAAKLLILAGRQTESRPTVEFQGPRLLISGFDLEEMRIEIKAAIQAMLPITPQHG